MCKTFKFDLTNQRYKHNPAPVLENNTHNLLWDFDIHTDHLILARRPDLIIINKKKRISKIADFAGLADHRIKLREYENKDEYLDLARELKKIWNMKVIIIPFLTGAFGTVTKGLLKNLGDLELDGGVDTLQTKALLRTARIQSRVLETCTQTPVKNNQLTLMWKTQKKKKRKIIRNWHKIYKISDKVINIIEKTMKT